jgi:phage portal protein BeeE
MTRDGDGDLVALPWENVSVRWWVDGSRPMPPVWYMYFNPVDGQMIEFRAEELAHLRFRNWNRLPWIGIPPLIAISDSIGLGVASRMLQTTEFTNGTRIQGYLTTAGRLDRQKAADIAQRWAQNYAGADQGGKTAVLEQGLEFKALDLKNLVELQMAELQKSNDADILRAFNLPPQVAGEIVQNRANAQEATRLLVMTCLQPMARRTCDALGLYLLTPEERAQGVRVSISLRDLTRGHGTELADSLSKLVLAGIVTRNEARSDLGLMGQPDAAALWQPVHIETTDQAAARSASNIAATANPSAPDLQAEGLAALHRAAGDAWLDELEQLIGSDAKSLESAPAEAAE